MTHFEYFSEIEERFTARRGSLLLLSTLDWALIETWREAGVPLAAVLQGIDTAFDRYEARRARAKGRLAKVNGLAWCAQAVMEAATAMAEAAIGLRSKPTESKAQETGFETERVARFLESNAASLAAAKTQTPPLTEILQSTSARLGELAAEVRGGRHPAMDELDRLLTVLEERLHAALLASMPEVELLATRKAVDRELTSSRARLGAVQMRQVREQILHKRLFEAQHLPRLSLFYMPVGEAPSQEDDLA